MEQGEGMDASVAISEHVACEEAASIGIVRTRSAECEARTRADGAGEEAAVRERA